MRKKFVLLLLLAGLYLPCLAQNEANHWYFGDKVGLDFNDGCLPTVVTDGEIDGFEGCATMSDPLSGELLFYTNSMNVWDRNGNLMNNGPLVYDGRTITQVTIVPHPGYDSLYYIITSEIQAFSGEGLVAHGIDMTLNGGLGGLSFNDKVLHASPMTEKVTATRHANGTDIWILAHEYNSNHFLAFLLTAAGIDTVPVVSAIGKVHASTSTTDAIGEMKVAPDGSKLAIVTFYEPDIELFEFDNATGQVANRVLIPERGGADSAGFSSGIYSCSFSPNGQVLYVGTTISGTSPCSLLQFDVSSGDSATIGASRVALAASAVSNSYGLKLAPNGKIYRAQNANYLGVINFPDSLGTACGYVHQAVTLNAYSGWGLNNIMELTTYCTPTGVVVPSPQAIGLGAYPNPATDQTTIDYVLPADALEGEILIFDLSGREVRRFKVDAAASSLRISTTELPAGTYLYHLSVQGDVCAAKRIVVVK